MASTAWTFVLSGLLGDRRSNVRKEGGNRLGLIFASIDLLERIYRMRFWREVFVIQIQICSKFGRCGGGWQPNLV